LYAATKQKEEGDDNVVAIAFFVVLQQNKKEEGDMGPASGALELQVRARWFQASLVLALLRLTLQRLLSWRWSERKIN